MAIEIFNDLVTGRTIPVQFDTPMSLVTLAEILSKTQDKVKKPIAAIEISAAYRGFEIKYLAVEEGAQQ